MKRGWNRSIKAELVTDDDDDDDNDDSVSCLSYPGRIAHVRLYNIFKNYFTNVTILDKGYWT